MAPILQITAVKYLRALRTFMSTGVTPSNLNECRINFMAALNTVEPDPRAQTRLMGLALDWASEQLSQEQQQEQESWISQHTPSSLPTVL